MHETGMDAASRCYSDFFGVAPSRAGLRTSNAEVGSSSLSGSAKLRFDLYFLAKRESFSRRIAAPDSSKAKSPGNRPISGIRAQTIIRVVFYNA